jgi:hypothetical protein
VIRISDLQEAIAECQGEKNPNAQTCIKLAAYYTILNQMTDKPKSFDEPLPVSYSAPPETTIDLTSGSEFAEVVNGRKTEDVMPLIDELVQTVAAIVPALYEAFIRKLKGQ